MERPKLATIFAICVTLCALFSKLETSMTTIDVRLRPVIDSDLEQFFNNQRDPEACYMAAFSARDPNDRAAFEARWQRIRADETVILRTVLVDGAVAGYVTHFELFGDPAVAHWLGKAYWGQGIATCALGLLLREVPTRPLFARAAKDNLGSIRVLQKCGFVVVGEDRGVAEARGMVIDELILRLD
jgi:RimJ/RimL family protein N-acetyltransferase